MSGYLWPNEYAFIKICKEGKLGQFYEEALAIMMPFEIRLIYWTTLMQ